MHGRALLLSRVLLTGLAAWLMAGCEPPRIKSKESVDSATLTNPPRDFSAAPLDPYSYGGIAGASGGRDPHTSYGALAKGNDEGATAIYDPAAAQKGADYSSIYLVPDPNPRTLTSQTLGSAYLDNQGNVIAKPGLRNPNPPRVASATAP